MPEASRALRTDGSRSAPLGNRFRLALSLSAGIILSAVFVGLLILRSRTAPEPPTAPDAVPQPSPRIAWSEPAYGSPTEKTPFAPPESSPERFGGKYPRWNLKETPEGWSDEIAATIHAYFEAMQPAAGKDNPNLGKIREELQAYLDQLGPEALPTLAAILNADGDFVARRFALYTIGNLGPRSESATFILHDFFMARHANPENRSEVIHVVLAMTNLQNQTSYDTLRGWIEQGDAPALHGYRSNFVEALGEHPRREEAIDLFVETMHDDALVQARNKSAQALGKLRSPETLQDLYSAVRKERSWFVKQTMLGSIGKIGDPSSIPFLEDQARNAKESGVRLSAANAINKIGTPDGSRILADIASNEPDPEVRSRVVAWISHKKGN